MFYALFKSLILLKKTKVQKNVFVERHTRVLYLFMYMSVQYGRNLTALAAYLYLA